MPVNPYRSYKRPKSVFDDINYTAKFTVDIINNPDSAVDLLRTAFRDGSSFPVCKTDKGMDILKHMGGDLSRIVAKYMSTLIDPDFMVDTGMDASNPDYKALCSDYCLSAHMLDIMGVFCNRYVESYKDYTNRSFNPLTASRIIYLYLEMLLHTTSKTLNIRPPLLNIISKCKCCGKLYIPVHSNISVYCSEQCKDREYNEHRYRGKYKNGNTQISASTKMILDKTETDPCRI